MPKAKDNPEIRADIKRYGALADLKVSQGGQVLIAGYLEDILASVETLATRYSTLTHIQMIAVCAGMNEKLYVLNTLLNGKPNRDLAKEALKEALAAEPDETS